MILESFLYLKEALFYFVLNIRLQLFFHIKHFHVLSLEILQWMLLVRLIRLEEFVYWLLNINISFHWIIILTTYVIDHGQGCVSVAYSLHISITHLLKISSHWKIRIIGEILNSTVHLLIWSHYILEGTFSQRHGIDLLLVINSKHRVVLRKLHSTI